MRAWNAVRDCDSTWLCAVRMCRTGGSYASAIYAWRRRRRVTGSEPRFDRYFANIDRSISRVEGRLVHRPVVS